VNRSKKTVSNIKRKLSIKSEQSTEQKLAELAKSSPFLRDILGTIDKTLVRKYKKLYAQLVKVLSSASPKSTQDLISGIAVDLADFQEIAVEHQRRVKKFSQMHFPEDQEQFIDMLYEFEIRLVMHAEWHAKHLKARLAKLKRDLRLTT